MSTQEKVTSAPAGALPMATAGRTEKVAPDAYRLARKPDGALILQGAFLWQQGGYYGYEWRDIPTVET